MLGRFIPDGMVPESLNNLPVAPWSGPARGDFEALASTMTLVEPPFTCPGHLKTAAGAVVVEFDGRVWLACQSNGFGAPQTIPWILSTHRR